MSFLNPVNEPVLRFSSTDADAPQINYNARVAGDVKAVLKACLVTGYGATESAGWTAENEVGNVAEFVSPSVSMSDYRLGINDTSASSTTWYYQYQDVRADPKYNAVDKNISYANLSSERNGWQLIATNRGCYFIEFFENAKVTAAPVLSRIVFFGQVKSALTAAASDNIGWWQLGYKASTSAATFFDRPDLHASYSINGNNDAKFSSAGVNSFGDVSQAQSLTTIDLLSELYITNSNGVMLAKQVGVLLSAANNINSVNRVFDTTVDARQYLSVSLGFAHPTSSTVESSMSRVLIPIDYWEY